MSAPTLTEKEYCLFLEALHDLDPNLPTEDLLAEADEGSRKIAAIRALAERPDAPVNLEEAFLCAPVRSLAAAYASDILTDNTLSFYTRVVERRLGV